MDVFDFIDYKAYLRSKLDELDKGGRGSRSRLSREINCQTAYTAQVLKGNSHFSLEQGEEINHFLAHTEEQGYFFLLILQLARTGSTKLKSRIERQIQSVLDSRLLLKNRLGVKAGLSDQDKQAYYSAWHYGAIHALLSVPGYQSIEAISRRLMISPRLVAEAIDVLERSGLIEKDKQNKYRIKKGVIHLGANSSMVSKHHTNWRLQAIRSLERSSPEDLHYSSVISVSKSDEKVIKEKLIEAIKDIKGVIRTSKEEEVFGFSIDFFCV